MIMKLAYPVYLLLMLVVLLPGRAFAHALEGEVSGHGAATAVLFTYSTGDPARFIKVEVYSPSDRKTEFQTGRTDMLGRVVFLPDQAGEWMVVASDNQGHRTEFMVSITSDADHSVLTTSAGTASAAPAAITAQADFTQAGKLIKASLGLSLILNLTLFVLWRFGRKTGLDEKKSA